MNDIDQPAVKRQRVDVAVAGRRGLVAPTLPAHEHQIRPSTAVFFIPLLMNNIIDFLSIKRNKKWKRRRDASHFLKTIASLCCALPSAAAEPSYCTRYGPSNQDFWKAKLFQYFDFKVKCNSSVNFPDDNDMDVGGDPDWERQHDAVLAWQQQKDAGGIPEYEDGERCLIEDLVLWRKLHVWHRPSQYGYLTEIQAGRRALSDFPTDVDAFGLFVDLAFMVSELRMHATSTHPTTRIIKARGFCPVLLGCVADKVTPRGTDLIELCGFTPIYWDGDVRMVSLPWDGLSPESLQGIQSASYAESQAGGELQLPTGNGFGGSGQYFRRWRKENELRAVKKMVRRQLCDWRHVRVRNNDGPQFLIGKRRNTNRWVGFV